MVCSLSGSSVHGDSPDKNTGVGCHALLYLYLIYISSLVRKTKIDLLTLIKVNRGKESACDAGDLGSIPGSERSPGEGNGNLLQCSYLKNPWTGSLVGYSPLGHKESDMTEQLTQPARIKVNIFSPLIYY